MPTRYALMPPQENIQHRVQNQFLLQNAVTLQGQRPPILQLPPPPASSPHVGEEKENVSDAVVPFNCNLEDQQVPSFDIMSIINEVMNEKDPQQNPTTAVLTTNTTSTVMNNTPRYMFGNCSIGNITFNFKK